MSIEYCEILGGLVGSTVIASSVPRALDSARREYGNDAVNAVIDRVGGLPALYQECERASREYWDENS